MKDCEKYRQAEWQKRYLLKQLTSGEIKEFERHLADCPECRMGLERERILLSGIRADGKSRMKAEIMAQARQDRKRKQIRILQTAAAAAAVLLVVVLTPTAISYYRQQGYPAVEGTETYLQNREKGTAEQTAEKGHSGISRKEAVISEPSGNQSESADEDILRQPARTGAGTNLMEPEPETGNRLAAAQEESIPPPSAAGEKKQFEPLAEAPPLKELTDPDNIQLTAESPFAGRQHNAAITGRIIDEDLEPVEGAVVWLESTELGAVTDSSGEFLISGIPPGDYSVQIQGLGYGSKRIDDIHMTEKMQILLNDTLQTMALAMEMIQSEHRIIGDSGEGANLTEQDVAAFDGIAESSGYAAAPPVDSRSVFRFSESTRQKSGFKPEFYSQGVKKDAAPSNQTWNFRSGSRRIVLELHVVSEVFVMDSKTGLPAEIGMECRKQKNSDLWLTWFVPPVFLEKNGSDFELRQISPGRIAVQYQSRTVYEFNPENPRAELKIMTE